MKYAQYFVMTLGLFSCHAQETSVSEKITKPASLNMLPEIEFYPASISIDRESLWLVAGISEVPDYWDKNHLLEFEKLGSVKKISSERVSEKVEHRIDYKIEYSNGDLLLKSRDIWLDVSVGDDVLVTVSANQGALLNIEIPQFVITKNKELVVMAARGAPNVEAAGITFSGGQSGGRVQGECEKEWEIFSIDANNGREKVSIPHASAKALGEYTIINYSNARVPEDIELCADSHGGYQHTIVYKRL